ncbi:MAG TPA: protein-PII uridylyltransferase, partial [Bdellovibrionales bacterium]|nr:protein-PII uridylyltransferase [Bdellovibrionales bacterium]
MSGDVEEGRNLLLEGVAFPNVRAAREKFSGWLEDKLLARLKTYGDFEKLKPVLLGSWSRHELTPKSDIDLLFTGEEADVGAFTGRAFKDGVKLRGRTPKDPKDWSVGVEPFDLLALHQARPLSENPELESQRHHAVKRKREILKAMKREREERRKRQDSISNYLEPNLKYGAGGLRDIEQALALRRLAPEPFKAADDYAFKVLEQIKEELLFIRSWLHLNGSSDVLSAHDQIALAKDLGFESAGVLMKFVQSELERASFYADWVVAYHQAGPKARRAATENLSDPAVALKKLRDDPSLLRQFEARRHVDEWGRALSAAERGKLLHTAVHGDEPDAFLVALYRTRWLEILIPDFKKLKGLVQHDHYHRFTADAHLVQALREVQRLKKHPAIFGIVGRLGKELTAADWWTLKLTALFHDLAKGRKGDHSSEGAKLV